MDYKFVDHKKLLTKLRFLQSKLRSDTGTDKEETEFEISQIEKELERRKQNFSNKKETHMSNKKKAADIQWLWMRLGDAAEYEKYDSIKEAFDILYDMKSNLGGFLRWRGRYGFETENFENLNYISFYWGDDDAQPVRDLNEEERKLVESEVNRLAGESTEGTLGEKEVLSYIDKTGKQEKEKTADYQGYKNYETWAVALWLDNEQASREMVNEWAQEAKEGAAADTSEFPREAHGLLADKIKEYIEGNNPLADKATVYSDLLGAAISEVDWIEIAKFNLEELGEGGGETSEGEEESTASVEEQEVIGQIEGGGNDEDDVKDIPEVKEPSKEGIDLKDTVLKYFEKNKAPTDVEFHAWAEKEGIDTHEAEEAAYSLVNDYVELKKKKEKDKDKDKGDEEPPAPDEEQEMLRKIETAGTEDLIADQNTPEAKEAIKKAFDASPYADTMEVPGFVYEHGHWWVSGYNSDDEPVQYSVIDAEGPGSIGGFDFEQVT